MLGHQFAPPPPAAPPPGAGGARFREDNLVDDNVAAVNAVAGKLLGAV
jgi:hypothetical protein